MMRKDGNLLFEDRTQQCVFLFTIDYTTIISRIGFIARICHCVRDYISEATFNNLSISCQHQDYQGFFV